jgi:chromosome segregation ATPase
MLALLASPWLPLAAAFLSGLLVKWLLDMFFLRRSLFETQATLLTRERQITDLRHELNRSIETLKNRTIELDATVKAKAAAEALGTQRLAENLATAERAAAELAQLRQARSEDASIAANLRAEVQTLLGHVSGERSLRRSAESEALDLKLHQATAASLASDQESALQSLRLAQQLAVSENETLRPLIDQVRHELAAQRTVNAALQGAVQLRDTTLEGLRTQLASAEAECQSVSQLLARQDEERKRLAEVQTALAEAETRCASSQAEADAARLQLETVQTQRMDFDAALMLKEAQANAWERECRTAKNRADTAVRKSATDAQALESLKAELAAYQTELAAVKGSPTASAAPTADPALAQRMKDLETELAVVSESHARLESELAESKALASRAEDLSEQLGTVEAELAALKLEPPPSPSGDLETLLQDLDTLTRERNQLAAEVASLKATGTRPDSV